MKYFLLPLLLLTLSAAAQEQIETDRPSQTYTASVVPAGRFQAEAGFTHTQAGTRQPQYELPDVLFKYGINQNFELRVDATLEHDVTPDSTATGLQPLVVGLKTKLADEKGWLPQTSLIVQMHLPKVASKPFQAEELAPELLLAMSNSFGSSNRLQYNIGVSWNGESAEPTYVYTLAPSFEITDKLNAFVETYAFLPQHSHPDHWVDGGFYFLITNNFQIDISGGYELSAHDHYHSFFESVGFSFRI